VPVRQPAQPGRRQGAPQPAQQQPQPEPAAVQPRPWPEQPLHPSSPPSGKSTRCQSSPSPTTQRPPQQPVPAPEAQPSAPPSTQPSGTATVRSGLQPRPKANRYVLRLAAWQLPDQRPA
jgi:hypothetical protein